MKISFELFQEVLGFIETRSIQTEILDAVVKDISPESNIFDDTEMYSLLTKMLKEATNDKYDYISYWMWELDFGDSWEPGTLLDTNNEEIPLKTVEDLWKFLESTYEENAE